MSLASCDSLSICSARLWRSAIGRSLSPSSSASRTAAGTLVDPSGTATPNSRSTPRSRLSVAVRSALRCSRNRCSAWMPCCSGVLTGTGAMPAQRSASSIPATSLRSVLLPRT
uniref:Uncharacterized protein n=1 Tax=Pseudomonas aeruginosa TaxID=287 RepID=A0A0K2SR80_PSEAI|nr:hypothetical protein [Pseudomonas aeruginosa]